MVLSNVFNRKSCRATLGALALGAVVAGGAAGPAQAHDGWGHDGEGWGWDHRGYDRDREEWRDGWRDREWREHEWRERHPVYTYGYYAPPVTYAVPQYYNPGGLSVYIPLR